MRLHVLQHVPFENEAAIGPWAAGKQATVSHSRLFAGEKIPGPQEYDWLVIMGGPMSVSEEEVYPWLKDEKSSIADAIEAGKTVLGVCLGAQLIAHVLGARVYRNREREIGWYPVELTEAGSVSPLFEGMGQRFTAFHWHGDTFDVPAGCEHLAQTIACQNQAFSMDNRVMGLQFHLESTATSVHRLLSNCRSEIGEGPWMQEPDEIDDHIHFVENLAGNATRFLDNMLHLYHLRQGRHVES